MMLPNPANNSLRLKFALQIAKCVLAVLFIAGCAGQREFSQPAVAGKDIILEVIPDKTHVYPDEKIVLRYVLSTRRDTRYEGFSDEARFPDFWLQDVALPPLTTLTMAVITRNDKKYVTLTIAKKSIFPMSPGQKKIFPGTIKLAYTKLLTFSEKLSTPLFSDRIKRFDMMIEANPVDIWVKPFPEKNVPPSFTGSFGRYSMQVKLKDEERTRSGEILLSVKIEGDGNFAKLTLPEVDWGPDLKLLHTGENWEVNPAWGKETNEGSKIFDVTLAAQRTGQIKIPSVVFSFFSPARNNFETLTGPEIVANVENLSTPSETKDLNDQTAQKAVVILVDASGSMLAQDFAPKDRLTAAKKATKEVLLNYPDTLVGVKAFGRNVVSVYPLSRPSGQFDAAIDGIAVNLVVDGTAIGSAIYEGVKDLVHKIPKEIKKSLILVTDGSYNSGFMDPLTAAQMAKEKNIPIHTIAMGQGGLVPFPIQDPKKGLVIINAEVKVDEATLKEIATLTGGQYFRVRNEGELQSALNNIRNL